MTTATQYQQATQRLQELAKAEQNELVAQALQSAACDMAIKYADEVLYLLKVA